MSLQRAPLRSMYETHGPLPEIKQVDFLSDKYAFFLHIIQNFKMQQKQQW